MKYLLMFFLIFSVGCSEKKKSEDIPSDIIKKTQKDVSLVDEKYIDSLNVGIPKKYKIELKKYRNPDSVYVEINFFEKNNSKWLLKQNFHFLKDGVLGCDVQLEDFNNDKLNDFTFVSSIAARGANSVRKLFLFDKEKGKLVFIKNSEEFPNLRYNKDLDCIDAFRVYGGTQTVFAKIDKDSLREFANVELFNERITINTIDKNGKETTIRNDKYDNGSYIRFKNYFPLKELEEEY
ncbi:XAC2610-related protein [Flavobacterium microcysteis]|uniref:Lipoprotein n=1 Tax=Flavobacterium microcysteis TaxID=2596891 RepID=A0A501Q3C2_9FLAO|nr:hypothetical protein [Flavobacterium microcysteis]TPD66868.1 hypothetical protein FJA49_11310 [Flavobacterium microcysteis]